MVFRNHQRARLFAAFFLGAAAFAAPVFSESNNPIQLPNILGGPSKEDISGGPDIGRSFGGSQVSPSESSKPITLPNIFNPGPESADSQNINWPTPVIKFSQIQQILSQLPGVGNVNIHFPNSTSWNVTPDSLQSIYKNYTEEGKFVGYRGQLPELSFSSLSALSNPKAGGATLAISQLMGGSKEQMDQVLHQLREQNLFLGDWMPEWMRRFILAVFDAFMQAMDFMYNTLAAAF
jgi:hypothetical protein